MNVKQLTALLAALTVLPGAHAQLVLTGSNVTTSGSPSLTSTYKQPQQFQFNGQLYPASAYWTVNRPPSPPGTLNGVNTGTTDADYVGPYTLNMACPNQDHQYWASWGGTCWACPGPVRIADLYSYKLTGDPANGGSCFKRLNPWLYARSTMTKGGVSSGVMSWDCASGEFWQMYDNKGNWTWWGGACYSCPAGYGWNGRGPTSGSDCVKPDDYAKPRLANFNGCPEPDAKNMGLAGQRRADKPFLDIAAGWSQGATGGGCFACPAVLEDGSIVVAERNANTLIGKPKGNNGCNIKVSYKPKPFPEPGLMGIDGVRDLVTEQFLLEVPQLMTGILHGVAESTGLAPDSAAARQFVKAKWEQIATNPAASPEFRSALFGAIREAALKQNPSETERIVVAAFSEYIRQRRIYVADVALNMYDTWKPVNDKQMASTRAAGTVTNLFYLGNVPFDFTKVAEAGLGFGVFTAASLAAAASSSAGASAFAKSQAQVVSQFFAEPQNARYFKDLTSLIRATRQGLYDMNNGEELAKIAYRELSSRLSKAPRPGNVFNGSILRSLTSLRGFATNVGPMLVMVVASFLVQMAIEQVIAIETARPKLLAAKEAAAAPVNLAALLSEGGGEDMAFLLWNKAMEGPAYADPALVQAAANANKSELARGYAKP